MTAWLCDQAFGGRRGGGSAIETYWYQGSQPLLEAEFPPLTVLALS